jgi:hypothetical protein
VLNKAKRTQRLNSQATLVTLYSSLDPLPSAADVAKVFTARAFREYLCDIISIMLVHSFFSRHI